MFGVTRVGTRQRRESVVVGAKPRVLTPAELAWIALIPCAVATCAALALLGPPLGHALFSQGSDSLWPADWWQAQGRPEPAKHGRYVIAVLAPLLLAAVVLGGTRRLPRHKLRPGTIRAATLTAQAITAAFVVVAALGQRNMILVDRQLPDVFGLGTLIAAALVVVGAIAVLRRDEVRLRLDRLTHETPTRRMASDGVAAAFTAVWLLEAVTTDGLAEDLGQMNWTLNDAFAVLDGRTPLVDYHLIYAKLLPYPAALALGIFGTTALVYTLLMTVLSVFALLGIYATFRRVVHRSVLALALFLPFVAISDIGHTMIMPAMWPMRYGGAYLMAWLTVRHLDDASPRRVSPLLFVGGLVAINDLEFGIAAVIATAAALLCADPPRSLRAGLRLAGEAIAGVVGAIVVVSVFTLIRAGALPDPALFLEWPRIFTNLGWYSMAMPRVSLHLAVYATFVAAVAVAAVRLARAADDALLTSMLVWSGVFGLVAGSYYVGRSDDLKLISMFSAWGFAFALLTIVTVRALAARSWHRPEPAQLLVLFAFAIALCSLVHMPLPHQQIVRLTRRMPPSVYHAVAERFVGEHARRGERVAIMLAENYRIAHDLGLRNVAPYPMQDAIVTRPQMQTLIDAVRAARVRAIFMPTSTSTEGTVAPQQLALLRVEGYVMRARQPGFAVLQKE